MRGVPPGGIFAHTHPRRTVLAAGLALLAAGFVVRAASSPVPGPSPDPWPDREAAVERRLAARDTRGALLLSARFAREAPREARAHALYGLVLGMSGRAPEAERAFAHALALRPGWAYAHGRRAQALRAMGRPVEALAAAEEAARLTGRTPDTLRLVGETAIAAGRPARALEAFAAGWQAAGGHRASPSGSGVRSPESGGSESAGRTSGLQSPASRLPQASPDHGAVPAAGRIEPAAGASPDHWAVPAAERPASGRRGPAAGASWAFDAAQAALLARRPRDALAWIERVDPGRAPYHVAVLHGRILEELGRTPEALTHYEHALAIGRRTEPLRAQVEARIRALRFPGR